MTFYVKTYDSDFDKEMKKQLIAMGLKEGTKAPFTFIFINDKYASYKNRWDTKKSNWISLLYGKTFIELTNKVNLHKKFEGSEFLAKSDYIDEKFPELPSRFLKILKPVGPWKGNFITITKNKSEVESWVTEHPKYKEWLLSDYIRNPALVDGRKFHLRVHVLAVKKKKLTVFMDKKLQYVLADLPYQKGDWLNTDIHDTHWSDNQPGYSFPDKLPDGWKTAKQYDYISDIIIPSLFSESNLSPEWNAVNGFHFFGLDVMFDKKQAILLEVNGNPGVNKFLIPGFLSIIFNGEHPDFKQIL